MSRSDRADTTLPGEGPVERWTAARKEEVVRRIESGVMRPGDVLRKWPDVSVEELDAWLQKYRTSGRRGLKATNQGRLF